MKKVNVKLKIVLLAAVLLLAAGTTTPAQALPFGVKSVAARSHTQSQYQPASWWKLFLKRLSRYAMAAN